ncbi:hypothetical protein GCM10009639_29180 [Kitasatospora putterlickiae]|uniref:Uncharacterized protein n=1 Tax=Kitasatospora putterlickiae TaxID=221725 RepID=A0ABP4INK7_9ACTN
METRSHHHAARSEEHATAPAGLGTWTATVLVCLAAGAAPLIGFWTFAH